MSNDDDALRETCVARMRELGLNANQVALKLDGLVSRSHVCDFLSRRASMGSGALQHLFRALELWPAPPKGRATREGGLKR